MRDSSINGPLTKQPSQHLTKPEVRSNRGVETGRMTQDAVAAPSGYYKGIQLPDFSAALKRNGHAEMAGTRANEAITALYSTVDQAMATYLGEPAVANWATFGKFASKNAGEQILRLETLKKATTGFRPTAVTSLLSDFVRHPVERIKQGWHMVGGQGFRKNVGDMRDALVRGNTGIITDIGPAYDTFLRAESAGQSGVAALRAAGYGHGELDPQGFILRAFEKYTEGKAFGERLRAEYPPELFRLAELTVRDKQDDTSRAEMRRLEAAIPGYSEALLYAFIEADEKRRLLVLDGNLYLGFQEQLISLQKPDIFGNPEVAKLLGALSPSMAMVDANGATKLLHYGGNWADFATRMGLVKADPTLPVEDGIRAFDVREADGTTSRYVYNTTCLPGTIANYMNMGTSNVIKTRNLLESAPGELSGTFLQNPVGQVTGFFGRLKRKLLG